MALSWYCCRICGRERDVCAGCRSAWAIKFTVLLQGAVGAAVQLDRLLCRHQWRLCLGPIKLERPGGWRGFGKFQYLRWVGWRSVRLQLADRSRRADPTKLGRHDARTGRLRV